MVSKAVLMFTVALLVAGFLKNALSIRRFEERNMAKRFRDEILARFDRRLREGNAAKRFRAAEEDYGNENTFLERAGPDDENVGGYVKNFDKRSYAPSCKPPEVLEGITCVRKGK